jgi:hypothetical protein
LFNRHVGQDSNGGRYNNKTPNARQLRENSWQRKLALARYQREEEEKIAHKNQQQQQYIRNKIQVMPSFGYQKNDASHSKTNN